MIRQTLCCLLLTATAAWAAAPALFQKPTVSRTHVAFVYAGDLWIVPREGGEARRLTAGPGVETDPYFSPDGSQIAFTGEYDGNLDVFVVPAEGGVPRRLTYHPSADFAAGWIPDGKRVLIRSGRHSYSRFDRLFTLPVDGGFPEELPLPMAEEGSFAPDGARLAYVPIPRAFRSWKRYRGGQATPIWIARLSDSQIERVPRDGSNDFCPMWVGNRVYFLSDRNGPVTLYAYDAASRKVAQVLKNDGLDFKSASAGPGAIVYEQFGSLHLYDLKSGQSRKLEIRLNGDLPAVRPRFEKISRSIMTAKLSPSGARALFEARGEILTVPAQKGDIRNLTNTAGVAERYAAWSPAGDRIAYFSDESGEYALHVREQSGLGEVKKIPLGNPPSFFFRPVWSPDGKKIAYTDKRLNLWYLELEKGAPVKIDTDSYDQPQRYMQPVWSPDSRWIAYTRQLKNHLGAVFLYSLDSGQTQQITDGMSDAIYVVFDKNGQHLYFTASTNTGLTNAWMDMSSFDHPVTRSVYVVVLRRDLPSPLAPESDDEKPKEEKPAAEKKEPVEVRIDLEGIGQRILALPIPARNYTGMLSGKSGVLFLAEGAPVGGEMTLTAPRAIHKFDLKTRKTDKLLEGVRTFEVSWNGEKMLYRQGDRWAISSTDAAPKAGEGSLSLEAMEMRLDPRAEWRQIWREAWRFQRDFFYDPGYHGFDLAAAQKKYEPYLESVASRADLNYLLQEALGNLVIGHLYISGGDAPEVKRVLGGLLGADYRIENGRYRFARVYSGENWNPQLRAPLTEPGVNVAAGEYLLAVNGRDPRPPESIYSFFESTAGKTVVLRVGPNPDGSGARDVTVTPIADERALRNLAWIEDNRRKVDQMSGGRVAYIYLPDTAGGGYTNFNRYYFAQVGKQAAVLDERFNGGGYAADYIIDHLRRPLMNYWMTREGEDFTSPGSAIFGPKVMITNEFAGSGGDLLPWHFRKMGLGPLVGKRTWGGLVGYVDDFVPLIDGGAVISPNLAFYSTTAEWEVENRGVPPDIEVELDPQAVRAGRDPQLEKAVEVVLEALKKNPPPERKRPAFPRYYPAK